jgi:hypothetical protein
MEMLNDGILSIDETEGEEISLTAELPSDQFTDEEKLQIESEKEDGDDEVKRIDLFASEDKEGDPLNSLLLSEDGITTLFMKKGGRVPFQGGGRDASSDDFGGGFAGPEGGASSGGNYGGNQNTGGGGNNYTGGGADQEDDVAQMMSDMNLTPDNAPDYTGSDYGFVVSEDEEKEKGGADYIGPKDKVRIQNEIINRKKDYDSFRNKSLRTFNVLRGAMSITNPFGFAKFVYDQEKKKKERIAEIDADLKMLETIGATKYTPHTDTIYQTLTQEKLDLTQPRSRDDDTGSDGPETIVEELMASNQVIEDRDETDIFNIWDKIKEKQAQRALLVEKGIIQDTAEMPQTKESMMLNSGGLANLFRVKTQ